MTFVQHFISTGQFQNSNGCFLSVNSTLRFGSRWWGRSPLGFQRFQNGLLFFGLMVVLQLFQRCYILLSKYIHLLQVLLNCRLFVNTWNFFRTGSGIGIDVSHVGIHCFLQRAQGVLDADRHIVSCADNLISFWHFRLHILHVISFQLFTSRSVNEAAFAAHFFRQCVMRVTLLLVTW